MAPLRRLLVFLAAFLAAPSASAFCRSTTCDAKKEDCAYDDQGCKTVGNPLAWPSSCVGFSLQKTRSNLLDSSEIDRVLGESLKTWSNVSCGQVTATMSLARRIDVACETGRDPSGPNANVIVFRDNGWTHAGLENTLAFTTVTYDVPSGEIFDADIEVNTAQNIFTTVDDAVKYDLQSILTHELGHAVGLAHSGDADATMYPTYDKGTVGLRTLSADDVDAICAAYPFDRAASCNVNGRSGFDTCTTSDTPEDGGGGCAVGSSSLASAPSVAGLSLLALAGLFRLRRAKPGGLA